jgi:hypothetical protein
MQTNGRRRLQQRPFAQYGLRFSSPTTTDAAILNQLRFTFQNFVNAVKTSGVTAAVPGLAAAVTAITNGAGAVQSSGELPQLKVASAVLRYLLEY